MQEDNNVFETSIDSGICDDITSPTPTPEEKPKTKMITYEQILIILERDKLLRAEQRKRLSHLAERRQSKKHTEEPCNVCCSNLDVENIKSSVKCVNCHKFACRGQSCSVWIPSRSGWECNLCNQSHESISKSTEWLNQQITGQYLSPLSARSEPSLHRNHVSPTPELDRRSDAASSFYGDQKERIREMIEETLADMLGGSLDNISVNQLHQNRSYLELFCKYHSPLSHKLHGLERSMLLSQSVKDLPTWENGEAPGISHIKLKRFIEKIINDAIRLPNFTNEPITPEPYKDQTLPFFDPKKYQELLATAVLNKIVDSYNYEQKFDNIRDAATDCSDLDKNHNALIGRKVQSGSISSSSIEPESDSSITDPPSTNSRRDVNSPSRYSDSNSLADVLSQYERNSSSMLNEYLTRHNVPLPDFSIESDSSLDDNLSTTKSLGNAWEDNWLFRKRRPGYESPAPVGMLVPSPKEDIKTQIGDRTADELSDLSEAGSECGDNNVDEFEDHTQNALIQNRNIIGGKSPVGIFDELLEQTSLISSSSIPEGDAVYTETKNDFVLGDDLKHDLVKSSAILKTEEAINSLVDTQNLQNNLSQSKITDNVQNMRDGVVQLPKPTPRSVKKQDVYLSTKDIPEAELTCSSTASSGSIAEREHKKWYNAVDMPNNPYSREALKRRLSTTSDKPIDIPNIKSPLDKATSEEKISRGETQDEVVTQSKNVDYKRYGRDYYINDAKCASGSSKQTLTSSTSLCGLNVGDDKSNDKEPTLQSQQALSSSLSSLHRSHSWGDKRSNLVPGGGGSTCDIFTARPVRVEESDPILSRATKLEYLSTPDRDFYLLPSEEISSLRSISASEHSLSQAGDSLTPSEDSDTIRVYDLKKQETRLIRDDDSISSVTPVKELNQTNSARSPPSGQPAVTTRPHLVSQRSFRTTIIQRGTTPTAFKFLQPKRRLYDTRRIMSEDTSSILRENLSGTINGSTEKSVIEEDVIPALPSVKALAKVFQNTTQDAEVKMNRPKSFSWKSVDIKTKEDTILPPQPKTPPPTALPTTNGDEKPTTEPTVESYSPPYDQQSYIPVETPVVPPIEYAENGASSSPEPQEIAIETEKVEPIICSVEAASVPETQLLEVVEKSTKSVETGTIVEKIEETKSEEIQTATEPCKDSYSPPYEQKYIPAEVASEQATNSTIDKPKPEEKVESLTSLEWRDDNVEIVSTPKEDQHVTPPNTPNEVEITPAATNQVTAFIVAPTTISVEVKETVIVEAQKPINEPTIVEKFLENEKNASMPPVDTTSTCAEPHPESKQDETASVPIAEPAALIEVILIEKTSTVLDDATTSEPSPFSDSTQTTEVMKTSVTEQIPPEETTQVVQTSQTTDDIASIEEVAPKAETALAPESNPEVAPSQSTVMVESITTTEPYLAASVPVAEPMSTSTPELISSSAPVEEDKKMQEMTATSITLEPIEVQSSVEMRAAQNGFSETSPISPTQETYTQNGTSEQKRTEIRFTQEQPRERPISPVLVPGKLKSSIAFFENLKNKK